MNDATNNNAKSTIADKIHQAVSSLLDTEMRLNADLASARTTITQQEDEIGRLQHQLRTEQEVRTKLERMIGQIADVVGER